MQKIITCITECHKKKKIVSLYCDPENPETHLTGFIDAFNDKNLIVQHISPSGFYDGFILIQTDDILRIDVDGKYERKVECLYKHKLQSHPELKKQDDLLSSLFNHACENQLLLSIELQEGFLTGCIKDYNGELLCMKLIDRWGCSDGEAVVISSRIISIAVDTISEQDIRIVYEANNQNSLDNK